MSGVWLRGCFDVLDLCDLKVIRGSVSACALDVCCGVLNLWLVCAGFGIWFCANGHACTSASRRSQTNMSALENVSV